jgi:hypothetical protein
MQNAKKPGMRFSIAQLKSAKPRTSALDKKVEGIYMSINENLTEELWDQASDFEARFF